MLYYIPLVMLVWMSSLPSHNDLYMGDTVRTTQGDVGTVAFICESYFTILVTRGHHRSRDVHLLVHWDSSYTVTHTVENLSDDDIIVS